MDEGGERGMNGAMMRAFAPSAAVMSGDHIDVPRSRSSWDSV